MDEIKEALQKAYNAFDFDKAWQIAEQFGLTQAYSTIDGMRDCVEDLCRSIVRSDGSTSVVSTGRFSVSLFFDEVNESDEAVIEYIPVMSCTYDYDEPRQIDWSKV
jgi:hypothetical protein